MNYYRYPRENHKCGLSATGNLCERGPLRGRCSRTPGNSELPSCHPIRTFRWWSQSIRIAMSVAALIVVSLAWSNAGRRTLLAPGPLSSAHAQLLFDTPSSASSPHEIDANNRCAACHPGWDGKSPVAGDPTKAPINDAHFAKQSQLCLQCHAKTMPDAVHGSPHDLTGAALQQLVDRGNANSTRTMLASFALRQSIDWNNKSTECSQCHREHQGKMHTLQEMASDKCQACHRNPFHSFSNGHPEFNGYPNASERNIQFDHNRHRDLHFTKKNAEFQCANCHVQNDVTGAVGQVFRSVSFESACATCHALPIKSALQDGLIVLQLPSLDKSKLTKLGADVGRWPDQASQMNDGAIPPIMRWLIEFESEGKELLDKLPASGRLADIDLQQPEQRDALVALAHTTKYLLKKLANSGQPGFRTAVQQFANSSRSLKRSSEKSELDDRWLDRFASGIPPDLFRAAYTEWFGISDGQMKNALNSLAPGRPARVQLSSQIRSLDDDLLIGGADLLTTHSDESLLNGSASLLDSTKLAPLENMATSEVLTESGFQDTRAWEQLSFGGWMIDRQRMAIVYVPNGHADSWLSRWVELSQWGAPAVSQERESSFDLRLIAQQCTSCHTLNVGYRSWKAKNRPFNMTPITRFDHTPHLTLPATKNCTVCHQLNGAQESVSMSIATSIGTRSEFLPMSRNQCATCHQTGGAGESCTQCHNYHVGQASLPMNLHR